MRFLTTPEGCRVGKNAKFRYMIWCWKNISCCWLLSHLFLRLVLDEVNLGFGGLRGSRLLNFEGFGLVRFLDQHVDEGLLLVVAGQLDVVSCWCWWCGRLNEHNLVVFLCWTELRLSLGDMLLRFWWRYVEINMFLDEGGATVSPSCAYVVATRATANVAPSGSTANCTAKCTSGASGSKDAGSTNESSASESNATDRSYASTDETTTVRSVVVGLCRVGICGLRASLCEHPYRGEELQWSTAPWLMNQQFDSCFVNRTYLSTLLLVYVTTRLTLGCL